MKNHWYSKILSLYCVSYVRNWILCLTCKFVKLLYCKTMLKLWGKPIFNWDFCKRKKYINRTRIGFRIIFEFLFILNEKYICNKKKKVQGQWWILFTKLKYVDSSFRGLSINDILTNRGSWISNVQNGKFMSFLKGYYWSKENTYTYLLDS